LASVITLQSCSDGHPVKHAPRNAGAAFRQLDPTLGIPVADAPDIDHVTAVDFPEHCFSHPERHAGNRYEIASPAD
jgi:hypothetical protein